MSSSLWPVAPLSVKQVEGFAAAKVESIALAAKGTRLFVGTSDGVLFMYECRNDTPAAIRSGSVELVQISQLLGARGANRDKSRVSSLVVVDEWRALLGVMDTCLTIYDTTTCRQLAQEAETKGVAVFAVHEPSRRVIVATKKKVLLQYGWAGSLSASGPLVAKGSQVALSEVPLAMCCTADVAVVGFKKGYALIDLASGNTTKLMDTDRPGICLELPATPLAPARVLLSSGSRGVFVNLATRTLGDERISWSAPPLQACIATPFLLAATERTLEVHDLGLLRNVQTAGLGSADLGRCLCAASSAQGPHALKDLVYLCGKEGMALLRVSPLEAQVESLVKANKYEEALSLCDLCPNAAAAGGITSKSIHERYAISLLGMGDYEAAVGHFIQAASAPCQVVAFFPTYVPTNLPRPGAAQSKPLSSAGFSSPAASSRAAAAVVRYLENVRPSTHAAADEVERRRKDKVNASNSGQDDEDVMWRQSQSRGKGEDTRHSLRGVTAEEEDANILVGASMVDTVLLVARLHCVPPRKWDIVDLLSRPNRVHEASCLPLLAERGVAYAEALLWLYRSVGAHERVLQNLTEAKCVSPSDPEAMTVPQFYAWSSDYLRSLWRSSHASEVRLVVTPIAGAHEPPVVALLRANPLLGLRVFLPDSADKAEATSPTSFAASPRARRGRLPSVGQSGSSDPSSSTVLGGLGMNVKQVTDILRRVTPDASRPEPADSSGGGEDTVPLEAKLGLAVAYLEALIAASGGASSEGHDELGLLLVEGAYDNDQPKSLRNAFANKLRAFLLESTQYDPTKLLAALPPDAQLEKALVLSRLGQHEAVLRIYVHELFDPVLAEQYCDRIYRAAAAQAAKVNDDSIADGAGQGSMRDQATAAQDVYLDLMKVFLTDDPNSATRESTVDVEAAVALLSRHFTRINPVKVLTSFPPSTPLARLAPFLGKAMRHLESEKRSLSVKHGLLKVHFMNLSHEVTQRRIEQLSNMTRVPALAKLGTPKQSLPAQVLSESEEVTGVADHEVTCVQHFYESGHVVLQFEVRNCAVKGVSMKGVKVRAVAADDDLFSVEAEMELPYLPFGSAGSCYVVLREMKQTMGAVNTSFSCDLFYNDIVTPLLNLDIST